MNDNHKHLNPDRAMASAHENLNETPETQLLQRGTRSHQITTTPREAVATTLDKAATSRSSITRNPKSHCGKKKATIVPKKDKKPKRKSLLDLPVELWRTIVETVFDATVSHIEVFHRLDPDRNAAEVAQPNILRVCSAIRDIYLPLYYQRTTFWCRDHANLRGELFQWLRAIGPSNRLYMQHFYVQDTVEDLQRQIENMLHSTNDDRSTVSASRVKLDGKCGSFWHITFGWQTRSDAEEGLPARYTLPDLEQVGMAA